MCVIVIIVYTVINNISRAYNNNKKIIYVRIKIYIITYFIYIKIKNI